MGQVTAQTTGNVTSLTALTALLLPGMLERRRGAIINVASTAASQPLPHMSVDGATKAYVLSFSRALWHETRGTGVDVVAICPGATATGSSPPPATTPRWARAARPKAWSTAP
ncbi:SDR family NAD(P)-dependent oxidoreductase [Microbacterium sp. BWR-S6Y]|uniref:SDR family NAD(P)-dependent oxidoreductase n=1 Tax=Microbacterium sp. BWR-S6Y TaxID=3232073 RepID=UPI0035283E28